MNNQSSPSNRPLDIEGVSLDAELLVKYRFVDRAVASLEQAIQIFPNNLLLREKLCEICIDHNLVEKASEQSIALSNLYAESGDLERANAILMQAKSLNPQLSIAARLEALRKAGAKKESSSTAASAPQERAGKVLSGDLSSINLFDVIQI